jgi:hypothetical protein
MDELMPYTLLLLAVMDELMPYTFLLLAVASVLAVLVVDLAALLMP